MADPFAIAASVASVLSASTALVSYLTSVKQDSNIVDDDLEHAVQEILHLEALCRRIRDAIRNESGIFNEREILALDIRRQTSSTLSDCEDTLEDFDQEVRKVVEDDAIPDLDKVRWFLSDNPDESHIVHFGHKVKIYHQALECCLTVVEM